MAATARTIAQLFGANSTVSISDFPVIADKGEFSFPVVNSVFLTSYEGKGRIISFSGVIRSGYQSTREAATDIVNALIANGTTGIRDYQRRGTLLAIFSGETSNIKSLYMGTTSTGEEGTIWSFEETTIPNAQGSRSFSAQGSTFNVSVGFRMLFRVRT